MLPRKIHIAAIDKFHDKFQKVSDELSVLKDELEIKDDPIKKERAYKLSLVYIGMIRLWNKIDDFCEYKVDHAINLMNNESVDFK